MKRSKDDVEVHVLRWMEVAERGRVGFWRRMASAFRALRLSTATVGSVGLTRAACIVFPLCCTNASASAHGDETTPASCERDVWQLSKLHCTWRDLWMGGIGPHDVTTANARACRRRTRCIAASDRAPILLMEREVEETDREERKTSSCTWIASMDSIVVHVEAVVVPKDGTMTRPSRGATTATLPREDVLEHQRNGGTWNAILHAVLRLDLSLVTSVRIRRSLVPTSCHIEASAMVGDGKPQTKGTKTDPFASFASRACRWRSPHDACDGLHHHVSKSPWSSPPPPVSQGREETP